MSTTLLSLPPNHHPKDKYRDEWAKRRRQCREVVEHLADGLEKKV